MQIIIDVPASLSQSEAEELQALIFRTKKVYLLRLRLEQLGISQSDLEMLIEELVK